MLALLLFPQKRIPLPLVPYIYFKVNENTPRKVNIKGYSPYFIRGNLDVGNVYCLSIFSIYPDFAEYFAHFPAYYVGLLIVIANGIQGTS